MPRKSAASLAIIPMGLPQRPEPPAHLTKAQATLWQKIVGQMPTDWLIAGSAPLLTAYVRHVATADLLARAINATDPDTDLPRYAKLTEMAARESKALCSLSTKLRLAPSNRFDSKKRIPINTAERKPWEHLT
jgi:hypothetical protein